jgi:hypothetical protein
MLGSAIPMYLVYKLYGPPLDATTSGAGARKGHPPIVLVVAWMHVWLAEEATNYVSVYSLCC